MRHSPAPYTARLVFALAILCFIAWLALVAFLRSEEASIVFMAGSSRWDDKKFDAKLFHMLEFATADGLHLDGVRSAIDPQASRYWILFCVASGAAIRDAGVQRQLEKLSSLGYGIMAFDYRIRPQSWHAHRGWGIC